MANLHVEEQGLQKLKDALQNRGEEYKTLLARLEVLVDDTLKNDIQGDLADDFNTKFQQKREDFNKIVEAIDASEEYAGAKGTDFTSMITTLKEQTH